MPGHKMKKPMGKKKKMDKKSEKEISKIEKNMMKASNAANDKMDAAEWLADKDTVEKFNDMVDNGKEVTFDTDEGTFTLLGAEGGMFNSALATNEKGEEVEIRFDDIKRIDSPDKPLSGKEELKKWAQQDKEAMDKYGDYIEKNVSKKMDDAAKKRLARDLMNKDFAIAYDRIICLVDGEYTIIATTRATGAGQNAAISINGTDIINANLPTDNQQFELSTSLPLKRGDYVMFKGSFGTSLGYNRFIITRL